MIFGPNGDQVVQKMQEWAQSKLEAAFDQHQSVSFVEESWEFYGNENGEGKKQGKAKMIWNQKQDGSKCILHGFFHDDHLVGNIHIKHLNSAAEVLKEELLFCKQSVIHGYYLAISECRKTFGIYINGRKHGIEWHAFPGGSFLCTTPTDQETSSSFIYPDFETVLHGSFDVPTSYALIQAASATLGPGMLPP